MAKNITQIQGVLVRWEIEIEPLIFQETENASLYAYL
jgi:hypothetical protein